MPSHSTTPQHDPSRNDISHTDTCRAHTTHAVRVHETTLSGCTPRTCWAATIDVGFLAVLHAIAAGGSTAYAIDAHKACAVRLHLTTLSWLARRACWTAAVDVGLQAILDAIAAGRSRAHTTGAHMTEAVRASLAHAPGRTGSHGAARRRHTLSVNARISGRAHLAAGAAVVGIARDKGLAAVGGTVVAIRVAGHARHHHTAAHLARGDAMWERTNPAAGTAIIDVRTQVRTHAVAQRLERRAIGHAGTADTGRVGTAVATGAAIEIVAQDVRTLLGITGVVTADTAARTAGKVTRRPAQLVYVALAGHARAETLITVMILEMFAKLPAHLCGMFLRLIAACRR